MPVEARLSSVPKFGYDGDNVWADLNSGNALAVRYVRPDGTDALAARKPAFQTLRRVRRIVLNERIREVRCNRDVLEDSADDVEHLVGFQLAPNDIELSE